jgi:hypothetical protein
VGHIQRAPGLDDHKMSFSVIYDDTDLSSYVAALKRGTSGTLIYSPDGKENGKPKFEGEMILVGVRGPNATIDKQMQMFELSFEAADEPTATIEDGDVWSGLT